MWSRGTGEGGRVKVKSVSYLGSFADMRCFRVPSSRNRFRGAIERRESSLINTLLGRRNVARTSNTPGRLERNFYVVNDAFCFVDMPGYGSRRSRRGNGRWWRLIARYLERRETCAGIVQLLDIRHTPETPTAGSFCRCGKAEAFCLAFNKVERSVVGASGGQSPNTSTLSRFRGTPVIAFSSETGEGA